jgi:hypothetical protein
MVNVETHKMPVKISSKLMPIIRADDLYAKWHFPDDQINEVYSILLGMLFVDLQDPDSGSIIYSCILKSFRRLVRFINKF